METVQQNGRFTLFSSKFLSIYSILYGVKTIVFLIHIAKLKTVREYSFEIRKFYQKFL